MVVRTSGLTLCREMAIRTRGQQASLRILINGPGGAVVETTILVGPRSVYLIIRSRKSLVFW
jgi:hypothetical protein